MNAKQFLLVLLVLGLSNSAEAQRPRTMEQFDSLQQRNRRRVGELMQEFQFVLPNGALFSNNNLEGKVTLINLWFESCAPCIAEMPALNTLHAKYASESSFQLISITFDAPQVVAANRLKYKIPFPVYSLAHDDADRIGFYNGYPTTFIIGPDGRIALFESGGRTDLAGAAAHIEENWYPILDRLLVQKEKEH